MDYNYRQIANEIVQRNINLFESFEDWTRGAFALSNLGQEGAEIFLAISQLCPKYNRSENLKKFAEAMKNGHSISISTFLYMCKQAGVDIAKYRNKDFFAPIYHRKETFPLQPHQEKVDLIDWYYLIKSRDNHSNFIFYLCGIFEPSVLERTATIYALGATRLGEVIFWQIDSQKKIHEGKVIQYNPETGHRTCVGWVGNILEKKGVFSKFNRKQCMFGEHLLTKYPEKPVAIVEAEKTAFICACIYPNYNWLAVGGEGMFTAERLRPLEGHSVIAFPDAHPEGQSFVKWQKVANSISFANIQISDYLERTASEEQKARKIDIADLLLSQLQERNADKTHPIVTELIGKNPALGMLIRNFDLLLIN